MKLTAKDIKARLKDHAEWTYDDDALLRTLTFASFPDAVAFVTRLAFDAEANDHHPDLYVSYNRVTIRWSTHSDGGVTDKDFAGVRQTERITGA